MFVFGYMEIARVPLLVSFIYSFIKYESDFYQQLLCYQQLSSIILYYFCLPIVHNSTGFLFGSVVCAHILHYYILSV